MDFYSIHATTQYDELMAWNGTTFIEGYENVDDPKQYDNMEQVLEAWDKAVEVAREMDMQVIKIERAEVLIESAGFKFSDVKRVGLKGYLTDKEHFELMLKMTEKARGDYLIKHRDIIEEYVTTWADKRHWGQVTSELEDEKSTIYKQVNALISIAKAYAFDDYKADILELSEAARMRCTFKAVAFMQVEDSKQMAKAVTQYGVDWGLVF